MFPRCAHFVVVRDHEAPTPGPPAAEPNQLAQGEGQALLGQEAQVGPEPEAGAAQVQGEGFSEVRLQGITVYPEATKDLGDLILGKDIALRGRVVDAQGRPVPGTSVSVHTIERDMATKGMLFAMAEQAASVPFPLQAVKSDDEGNFGSRG